MRRLLSSLVLMTAVAVGAKAQTPTGSEGSLFLLLPTGAQAVGMGQAMVAGKPGSEGIWWNPASIGEQSQRELAIHHSKTVAGVGDAVDVDINNVTFGGVLRTFHIAVRNLGSQHNTRESSQQAPLSTPDEIGAHYLLKFIDH